MPIFAQLQSYVSRFSADISGSVAIAAAFILPAIIGAVGLGVETGYWYVSQRQLQHVADVSAHAGAIRKRAGDSAADYTESARYVAAKSGFSGVGSAVIVNSPPLSGTFAGKNDAVEVTISEELPRYFTAFFFDDPVQVSARAVAELKGIPTCVLALSTTASGAFKVAGSTDLALPTCDIVSNSTHATGFTMQGASARINAACVYSSGGISANSNLSTKLCAAPKEYQPPLPDPYANVPHPAVSGACANGNLSNATLTPTNAHPSGVPAMRFCSGLSISGTVHLNPGLYIIGGGDLTGGNGAVLTGTGVTLFFTGGAEMKLNGNQKLNLSAPTSGPYSGIVLFGNRTTATNQKVNGGAGTTIQGAVYFPAAAVEYQGNSAGTNGCTQLIARTISFNGNSSFGSSCATAGTRHMATSKTVAVVE